MKEVKVTLEDLFYSIDALRKLSAQDMPIKIAWKVQKLLREAVAAVNEFQQTRDGIRGKYIGDDESLDGESAKKFAEEILGISRETFFEADIDFDIESIGEDAVVSGQDLYLLRWIFDD